MKKVIYESKLAKLLINNCTTIMLCGFVFTQFPKEKTPQEVINHECTHARQWIELTVAAGIILLSMVLILGVSAWWLLLSGVVFYVWYLLETFVRIFTSKPEPNRTRLKVAYRNVSFEQEARLAEKDNNYLENSQYFANLKFLFKNKS